MSEFKDQGAEIAAVSVVASQSKQEPVTEPGTVLQGAEIAAVSVVASLDSQENKTKESNESNETNESNVKKVEDKPIKRHFLDNLHLFFGENHLNTIKDIINPSHQLNEVRIINTLTDINKEKYENNRLMKLLKSMFFNVSNETISKSFVGGGITIEQLKYKIKKGISMIVPKY